MDRDARWKKSTFSGQHNCVELAWAGSTSGIRDSKAPDAGTLTVPAPALTHLLSHTKRVGLTLRVTAAATPDPRHGRTVPSLADVTPAAIRAALIPEEAAEFDQQWCEVMARARRAWTGLSPKDGW